MLIPLSWLKEFVDINLPVKDLAAKLSAAGLTVEKWHEAEGDTILDSEVTPNRPDWMSVYGTAREIAAITNSQLKPLPQILNSKFKLTNELPITIKPNYDLVPRITSVIIKGVKVRPSPDWLQKRIRQIGLRPINNLVDITNYVLWQHGGLLHAFDYDKIRGHQMVVEQAKGGEEFRSLDGISYKLPKGAVIIKDVGRVIDLLPLKGGENTSTQMDTKNVLLHSVVVDPILTRRTSQSLGLRSDSSTLAEKGLDPNSTPIALEAALKLILELAGGQPASQILDHKAHDFSPWTVTLHHERLENILGIKIAPKRAVEILTSLQLKPKNSSSSNKANVAYEVEIPTFRADLEIEEDLIEEVGRLVGYDSFPKTLPASPVPAVPAAYSKNFSFDYEIKSILAGAGYTEVNTYSLVSESQLIKLGVDPAKVLRIDNPISRDYEYLRPFLLGNLLETLKMNQPNFPQARIFEMGKAYKGETIDKRSEPVFVSAMQLGAKFFEAKGTVQLILEKMGIASQISPEGAEKMLGAHPGRSAFILAGKETLGFVGEIHPAIIAKFGLKGHVTGFFLNAALLEKLANPARIYEPVSKYPPIIEDVSLLIPDAIPYGDVVNTIRKTSPLVKSVDLLDIHEDSKTIRLNYLDPARSLTDKDAAEIHAKIAKRLKESGVIVKDK